MKCSLGISNFLEELSGLSHSIVLLYFFALITEEGFYLSFLLFGSLHSDRYIFPFLSFLLLLFFSLFVRPPQTTILPFCISSSWGWSWSLPPVQNDEPPSIVLQALCLSDLIPRICLTLPLYNHRDLIYVIPEWSSGFPYFLQFKWDLCPYKKSKREQSLCHMRRQEEGRCLHAKKRAFTRNWICQHLELGLPRLLSYEKYPCVV